MNLEERIEGTRFGSRTEVLESLKDTRDLTGADLTNSSLMRVDVTGANLTDTILVGGRAGHVEWPTAKIPPAELPGPLTTASPWLPVLLLGVGVVILVAILRKRAHQGS